MVKKVGDRRYWEQWAKSVAQIAERQVERIYRLIVDDTTHKEAFESFLNGLQKNINPSIAQHEAVEMLSQHIITKPVFEALFEGYSFVKNNPISVSMQTMLDLLEDQAIEKDTETLEKFYESVKMRAEGIDNAEGKQRIIIELYDKFFKTAFPKMVERLGIVYTPVEVVDFIINSVNDVLKIEFERSLSDENIHILDPFTGTGTFVTRLLQSGLIHKKDLERKYQDEIHANEIVLLAYYIAAVNIENTFHDIIQESKYLTYDGICLTDTFQLGESDDGEKLFSEMFPKNSERVTKQKNAPLRVIIGNPPYSVGQKSENDNAQNLRYEKLDARVEFTYARDSKAISVKALYDAYIKAFRWSTDRIDTDNGGIVCFVSNSGWLDGNGMDGFRKSLEKEYSSIYSFNLRGNARTQGELRRKEAGNVFGGGSRTPISITLLVKNPKVDSKKATIYYYDIGDYLNREEKLSILKKFRSVGNSEIPWTTIIPNAEGDWINQRNEVYQTLIPIAPEKKFDLKSESFFLINSLGLNTSRDAWCYNYSESKLESNVKSTIDFYCEKLNKFKTDKVIKPNVNSDKYIVINPKRISWDRGLKQSFTSQNVLTFNSENIYESSYRPFCKQRLYFDRGLNAMLYQNKKLFPNRDLANKIICVSSIGSNKGLSVLITDHIANLHFNGDTQCYPLYYYERRQKQNPGLFDKPNESEFVLREGVSNFILDRAKFMYGKNVTKEDIFYYVYGYLHSPQYKAKFAHDLKKMHPRLSLVDDVKEFWNFSKAGRELADLHLKYESVDPFESAMVKGDDSGYFTAEKMRFPKKEQKDTIIYNSKINIENIPAKAYEYIVNGKSAIEWIMERYQIKTHKDSGITNDPNDWADEVGNPRYVLDLLLSIINVSVKTVDIVNNLPKLSFSD